MKIILFTIAVLFIVFVVIPFIFAPEGYEDETGFHYGRNKK